MTVRRPCEGGCGRELVGRSDKRVCSDTCRKRVQRQALDQRRKEAAAARPPSTAIADALRREFVELGVAESAGATIALRLAEQLDSGQVLGAAFVSLSKELDRRVDVLRLVSPRPTVVDDIRRRVEEKRHLQAVEST